MSDHTPDPECGSDCEYWKGYQEGYDDAHEEIVEEVAESVDLRAIFESRSFNVLEDVRVRWDAALKAWVLSQDGREYLLREES